MNGTASSGVLRIGSVVHLHKESQEIPLEQFPDCYGLALENSRFGMYPEFSKYGGVIHYYSHSLSSDFPAARACACLQEKH